MSCSIRLYSRNDFLIFLPFSHWLYLIIYPYLLSGCWIYLIIYLYFQFPRLQLPLRKMFPR